MTIHDLKEDWYVFEIISVEEPDDKIKIKMIYKNNFNNNLIIIQTFNEKMAEMWYIFYYEVMGLKNDEEIEPNKLIGKKLELHICLYDLKFNGTIINYIAGYRSIK